MCVCVCTLPTFPGMLPYLIHSFVNDAVRGVCRLYWDLATLMNSVQLCLMQSSVTNLVFCFIESTFYRYKYLNHILEDGMYHENKKSVRYKPKHLLFDMTVVNYKNTEGFFFLFKYMHV